MIKKIFILISVFLLCTSILILPACEKEEPLSLNYEEKVSVQFLDPCGTFYVNTSMGYGTEYNDVKYKLAKALTEDERNITVTETNACFEILEDKTGITVENYTVYVAEGSYVPYTNGDNLYFGYNNIKTDEFATAIVQLVYGRDVNYGVLYGLGASIAEERGYKNELTDLENALTLCESSPQHLDLNYACFLDDYADGNLDKIKTLSVEFYKYLEANCKTDLLTDYSEIKRRSYFNQFLAANGKGEYNATDLDGFAFYGGGNTIRLMWENEHAKYNLYEDYKDYHANGSLGKDPLNCGYEDLRKHIVNFEAQMQYMRERLVEYNASPKKIAVNFNMTGYSYSYYDINNHSINASSVYSIKHEYTHSIINGKYGVTYGENAAVIHSLVYYFAHYPINEQLNYEVQIEQDSIDGFYDVENNHVEFFVKFAKKLGHSINLFDLSDYVDFHDNYAKYFGADENVTNSSWALVSLAHYLVAQYGEEIVCEAAFNNNPQQVLGKTWQTIISDWSAYLDKNYIL